MEDRMPIIIQGAMEMEIEELLKLSCIEKEESINNFKFYFGKIDNYPVIISKTDVGIINASISTMLAIQKLGPIAIINQGIAGSHVDYIHKNDIVIGEKCVNINAFITDVKNKNEGSDPFTWRFDRRSVEINCSNNLLNLSKAMNVSSYNLYYGVLGSGDIFNREVDRINWIREHKNTLCEDNESIAVYTICNKLNINCIGFRTISNNELTQTEEDGATSTRNNIDKNANKMIFKEFDEVPSKISQKFTYDFVRELIKRL